MIPHSAAGRSRRRATLAAVAALAITAFLPLASARGDHVTANPQVSAHGEPLTERSWTVVVDWNVNCTVTDGSYYGNLYLIDAVTRKSTYMGGVFSESGTARQPVQRYGTVRRMYPLLKISCSSGLPDLHGSPIYEVNGNTVLIPALGHDRDDDRRRGGNGGGGNGNGPGDEVWDPTSPLRGGGCKRTLRGTDRDDTLNGSGAAELILGLGGDDLIRGRGNHDCLIGHRGEDRLFGHDGWDRLTGGGGDDLLVGGRGTNRYAAGSGNDRVLAANGRGELVSCGSGRDRAKTDRSDRTTGCELVSVSG
jgi:RTX calcium-binding nonapeptide repeat (4 copies)